jgi:hypothetical protein
LPNALHVYNGETLGLLAGQRLPVVSVTPVQPDVEEVFVRLVGDDR